MRLSKSLNLDATNKQLLSRVQEGIAISEEPYKNLAKELGLSQNAVISRLNSLREKGILRRFGFSFDSHKLGLTSTLVGCKISPKKIPQARKVITACGAITHNYLRKHRLNMWFTLSAVSKKKLRANLAELRSQLPVEEMISLPTEKVFKLKFQLNVA